MTDASVKGWRAFCGVPWSDLEAREHINVLELKAAKFAIMTFTKMLPDAKVVHLQMNKMEGGTHKVLSGLVKEN